MFRQKYYDLQGNNAFQEKDYADISYSIMHNIGLNVDKIKECVHNSFVAKTGEEIDYELDDNTLLKEE